MIYDVILRCFEYLNYTELMKACTLDFFLYSRLINTIYLYRKKQRCFDKLKRRYVMKYFKNSFFDLEILHGLPILLIRRFFYKNCDVPIKGDDMAHSIMVGVDTLKQPFIAFKQKGKVFCLYKKQVSKCHSLWFKCNFERFDYTFPIKSMSNNRYLLVEETIQIIEYIYLYS